MAKNPDPGSRLPFLLRLPLTGGAPLVLATAVPWPGGKDAFCYEVPEWPEDAEIVQRVPVESCRRVGAAVHLVLRRPRQRRSMFVYTRDRRSGRPLIFWRTAATMSAARPGLRVPQARGLERALAVAVDRRERYPWKFTRYAVELSRRELPVGDYAVLRDGRVVAAVERKRVADLASAASGGALAALLADLEQVPRAALVVEGRLSDLVKQGQRGGVRPGWLLNVVAALQAAHPAVAWMFAETRDLAQDWAYRWLAACAARQAQPVAGTPEPAAPPNPAEDAPAHAAEQAPAYVASAGPGPVVLDAAARREAAVDAARAGTVWTSAAYAAAYGVTPVTAWKDLTALVAEGRLAAEGSRRTRRYVAPQE